MAEEINIVGSFLCEDGTVTLDLVIGDGGSFRKVTLTLEVGESWFAAQQIDALPVPDLPGTWANRGFALGFRPGADLTLSPEKAATLLKHRVFREERRWAR